MTWPRACTPRSVRPAQTAMTGSPATKDIAACTASWIDTECSCDCQPAYSVPSYSKRAATRRSLGPGPEAPTLTGQSLDQPLRFLFLAGGAFLHDLVENAARAFGVAHVHVGPRQVQLGPYLAHGHRFQLDRREIVGVELRGQIGRRDRRQLVGGRLGAIHRFAHVVIDAAALTGLEYFTREHVVFRTRLLDGVAASQCIRQ